MPTRTPSLAVDVAVSDEQREDGVADVLLDGAAVIGDHRAHLRESVTEEALHPFRPEPYRRIRRTHDVDEQACDETELTTLVHSACIVAHLHAFFHHFGPLGRGTNQLCAGWRRASGGP
jgi:hypothetical protein